jgi:hypothetical protein
MRISLRLALICILAGGAGVARAHNQSDGGLSVIVFIGKDDEGAMPNVLLTMLPPSTLRFEERATVSRLPLLLHKEPISPVDPINILPSDVVTTGGALEERAGLLSRSCLTWKWRERSPLR